MSSGLVRQEFRTALAAAFPSVFYAETIATRTDNNSLPDLWLSLGFAAESDNPISIGSVNACWREAGTVTVFVVAKAGDGDAAAVAQCDLVLAAFRRFTALSGGLRVMNVTPPVSNEETDGRWLVMSVGLYYQYTHYV